MTIRNDQYLHRLNAGRGAIKPDDPLEVRLYGPDGKPIGVQDDALKVALTGSEVERAKLTTPMTVSPGSLVGALEDIPVRGSKIFVNVKTPTSEPEHDFEIHILHRWAEVAGTFFTLKNETHTFRNSQVGVVGPIDVMTPHVSVRIRNMSDEAHDYVVYLGALP